MLGAGVDVALFREAPRLVVRGRGAKGAAVRGVGVHTLFLHVVEDIALGFVAHPYSFIQIAARYIEV